MSGLSTSPSKSRPKSILHTPRSPRVRLEPFTDYRERRLRYIFSPRIANCVREETATTDLTISCLAYLCQNHHNPELSKDDVESETLRGSYRLHGYAETMWLSLVEKCLALSGSNPVPPDLLAALKHLIETRSSVSSDGCPEPSTRSIHWSTRKLNDGHPEVYGFLLRAAEFRRQYSSTDFQFSLSNLSRGRENGGTQTRANPSH